MVRFERPLEVVNLPVHVQVERISSLVDFRPGPLAFMTSYTLKGSAIKVHRECVLHRNHPTCHARDDLNWTALRDVLRHDFRSQIFLK